MKYDRDHGAGLFDRRRVLAGAACLAVAGQTSTGAAAQEMSRMTAHAFTFPALEGGDIRLADFAGKPVLVVNTASFCGYTNQYGPLAALATRYAPRGLVVLGVPSNDFGGQEPGGPKEIAQTAHHYGATFPLTAKTIVRGAGAHRFYRWAAGEKAGGAPAWNFHKYLIDGQGRLVASFPSAVTPDDPRLVMQIEKALADGA